MSVVDITNIGRSVYSLTVSANAVAVNWNNGPTQKIDLSAGSATVTVTLTNPVNGAEYLLQIIEGSTAYQLIFSPTIKFTAGAGPVFNLSTTNHLKLFWDGAFYQELHRSLANA